MEALLRQTPIMDDFVNITRKDEHGKLPEIGSFYESIKSGKLQSELIALKSALRKAYPELIVTTTLSSNVPLLLFAEAGYAEATLDVDTDSIHTVRLVHAQKDLFTGFTDSEIFAKYHYKWKDEDFILYRVVSSYYIFQFVLKEPADGEHLQGTSKITDELLKAVGVWAAPAPPPPPSGLYVYDGYWYDSRQMYEEIKKSSWKDVILDDQMKKEVDHIATNFFDSKEIYHDLGVPWKRGIIFHGPAGNGKTISIKAIMHTLFFEREPKIPVLYVKSAPQTYQLHTVFEGARQVAPCLLVLEDIDTIVNQYSRSYFFNEVDGLENNDGILMIASTNHLDQLDPGLSQRPSRFDRKYLFDNPNRDERIQYCEFWRKKLEGKKVEFPEKLCPAIADITDKFSFAYLKEAFLSSLLALAKRDSDDDGFDVLVPSMQSLSCEGNPATVSDDEDDGDLEQYPLWKEIKKQVAILRKEMDKGALLH